MADYILASPSGLIAKALFNFDEQLGIPDFRLSGLVRVSVSDSFTTAQHLADPLATGSIAWTASSSGDPGWTVAQIANINAILATFSNVAHIQFSDVVAYPNTTPSDAGSFSDINISLVYRPDLPAAGVSGINSDDVLQYPHSAGDVVLNVNGFGPYGQNNDASLSLLSYGGHVLMHELGHSLGLAHPHLFYSPDLTILSQDFMAIASVGFEKLGFHIRSAADLNKEYFTIMSYDDQVPSYGDTFAQTPMILDVIALQEIYGEGRGSTGSGDDVVTPGGAGNVTSYRVYFDTGGTDTIDLANYSTGAYLNMGVTIVGVPHLVGVSMSTADADLMINKGGDPVSLRWFYGEFENAIGSAGDDRIFGNDLNNRIKGGPGDDIIDGGGGSDVAIYSSNSSAYRLSISPTTIVITDRTGLDGSDILTNIETLSFPDRDLSATWLTKIASLAPTQISDLVELYIASFNRAPDAIGLAFWGSQLSDGISLNDIARSFFIQPETIAAYPSALSTTDFIIKVYNNVLGRDPDAAGLTYWQEELANGDITKDRFLLAIGYGAQAASGSSADAQYLANKIWVGAHFALTDGLSDLTWAKQVMASCTGTASSTASANSLADGFLAAANTASASELVLQVVGIVA